MRAFRVLYSRTLIRHAKRELEGHESRRRVALQGGCAVLFGLPFALMGGGIVLAAAGVIAVDRSSFHADRLIVGGIGGLFLLLGLWLMGTGVAGWLRRARVQRGQLERPGEPWYWDHPWDRDVARLGILGKTVSEVVWMLGFSAFAAPFCVFFFPFGLILGLLALAGWGVTVYRLLQRLKYGGSEVRFGRFPFLLGSEMEVAFVGASRLRGYRTLTLTLRCVEEEFETRGNANTVVAYALYEDERTYGPGELDLGPGRPARILSLTADEAPPLPLRFSLPRDSHLSTRLSADQPCYWELEIAAETPGIDYKAIFLLPVYAGVVDGSGS